MGDEISMKTKRFDVVVVGELNPDLILAGDVVPEFGQVEKLVDQATLAIGSSSAIFACGASRLGLHVAFVGKVGRDLFGGFMRRSLEDYGIDTQGIVETGDHPTGISVILARGADRAILTYPGTIPLLKLSDIDLDILHQARHLHVASYFIQDGLRPDLPELFARAKKAGMSVSLDTNYDPAGRWEGVEGLLPLVDLFLPNEAELLGITRAACLEDALRQLAACVNHVGVKLGDHGAVLRAGSQVFQIKPLAVKVVDTVGAGDSFDAGFVFGFLAGWDVERTLRLANVCGGLSTRQPGGTAAQPVLEEALHYI